ncbi:hypothetical protein IX51_01520 [uncultured archaeon]|nr:hypothetical protein IX51_01520 [uncultured archaeon]HKJ96132.1 hypothetical protein [Thermoplasmataceae archaeon]
MKPDESPALKALKNISCLMNFEMLVSRPGISEPDSDFIWASTFKAPIGLSFVRDDIFFNLFLPEGSESDGDKKLFLKRVGAKFQDDLWQVRRSMDQMKGPYGQGLRVVVANFRTLVIDYAYIKNGRIYVHFTFNEAELDDISSVLLSVSGQLEGLRVEYMKRIDGDITLFKGIDEIDDVSTITIEATPTGSSASMRTRYGEIFFVLGNIRENGVKAIGRSPVNAIPDIIRPEDVNDMGGGLFSFSSGNRLINKLAESMASDYVVLYGFYGSTVNSTINLVINVPRQQTAAVMRILNNAVKDEADWKVKLKEITFFKDLIAER